MSGVCTLFHVFLDCFFLKERELIGMVLENGNQSFASRWKNIKHQKKRQEFEKIKSQIENLDNVITKQKKLLLYIFFKKQIIRKEIGVSVAYCYLEQKCYILNEEKEEEENNEKGSDFYPQNGSCRLFFLFALFL